MFPYFIVKGPDFKEKLHIYTEPVPEFELADCLYYQGDINQIREWARGIVLSEEDYDCRYGDIALLYGLDSGKRIAAFKDLYASWAASGDCNPIYIKVSEDNCGITWNDLNILLEELSKLHYDVFFVDDSTYLHGDMSSFIEYGSCGNVILSGPHSLCFSFFSCFHPRDNWLRVLKVDISYVSFKEYRKMYPQSGIHEYMLGGRDSAQWGEDASAVEKNRITLLDERILKSLVQSLAYLIDHTTEFPEEYPNITDRYREDESILSVYLETILKKASKKVLVEGIQRILQDVRIRYSELPLQEEMERRNQIMNAAIALILSKLHIEREIDEDEDAFIEVKMFLNKYLFRRRKERFPLGFDFVYAEQMIHELKGLSEDCEEKKLSYELIISEFIHIIKTDMMEKLFKIENWICLHHFQMKKYVDPEIPECRLSLVCEKEFAIEFDHSMELDIKKCLWLVFFCLSNRVKSCQYKLYFIYLGESRSVTMTFNMIIDSLDSLGIEFDVLHDQIQKLYKSPEGKEIITVRCLNIEEALLDTKW